MDNSSARNSINLDLHSSGFEDFSNTNCQSNEIEALNLEKTLAKKETRALRRLRVFIMFMLMVVAVLASVGIYFYSRGTEKREFENEFASQGLKVISGFQGDSFRKLQAMESLSNSITAYTKVSGEQWPFVTIPNSHQHFEPYLSLTNAASLLMMPIVGPRQRYDWETYAVAKQGWIDQDLATRRAQDRTLQELISANSTYEDTQDQEDNQISRYIKNYVGIDTSPASWIVWWQYAPVIPNRFFVNFNRLAWDGFAEEVKPVQDGKAVLSKTWTYEPGLDLQSTRDFDFMQELLQAGRQGTYEKGEPIGYIHYPVFDHYDDQADRKTVAILTATVYWRTYMEDLLPESEKTGIVCVIENSQGQKYSYKINGPDAVFLGSGALYDEEYSDQVISADYSSFQDSQSGWYTGVPVDTDYISYRIHVYPSSEFEEAYMTDKPFLYAAAIFAVFLLTVSIFILYDCYVERRQNIVMKSAVKTNAVVESLFPSNVRDQILDSAVQDQQEPEGSHGFKTMMMTPIQEEPDTKKARPIAELFLETSVFFADLSGFTQWSSNRTPTEVFELLETLYGAFDKIAQRRRVYKVETIGDCYVAATGIPQPQKNHALILARFAKDCMSEMDRITHELAEKLGDDTRDLRMRIGLHSGSTTGGVLRGQRSRFQLFGDTVNTASRMESNGVAGRVHVSQATANALIACGKGGWLVPREDKIEAKGKGLMQTYFLRFVDNEAKTEFSSLEDDVYANSDAGVESALPRQTMPKPAQISAVVSNSDTFYDEVVDI